MNWTGPQEELAQTPSRLWDVVVIGGGPAGATCALQLARAGYAVLVIDRARFPRHKACGDLLIPDALDKLCRLGLLDAVRHDANAYDALQVFSPSRFDFEVPGNFLSLRRYDFDALLMQAAIDSGAAFAVGDVEEVVNSGGSVETRLKGFGRTVRARVVVMATGASVHLLKQLGAVSRPLPSAFALRSYIRSDMGLHHIIISYDRSLVPGYGWIVPVGGHIYNVGCGVALTEQSPSAAGLKGLLGVFLDSFPPARQLMKTGERIGPLQGAPLRCGMTGYLRAVSGRTVAIGEAVGTTFPFTGEGIGQAIHSAVLASAVINRSLRADDPSMLTDIEAEYNRKLRPTFAGYAAAQRWLSYPWLNDLMARRVRRSRYLREQVSSFMAATGDPRGLYSPMALLRSFWS